MATTLGPTPAVIEQKPCERGVTPEHGEIAPTRPITSSDSDGPAKVHHEPHGVAVSGLGQIGKLSELRLRQCVEEIGFRSENAQGLCLVAAGACGDKLIFDGNHFTRAGLGVRVDGIGEPILQASR